MPVKILLADRSITIQKVVEMLFAGREYEVVCVGDGETALHEAERTSPDVVLADVDLPRGDGYSFAGQLKKNPVLSQTPVILMMSRDDVYDNAKGKQAGIVDKIVKPFESQELIGKVKKAVASAPVRPAKPASAAPTPTQQAAPAAPSVAKPVQTTPQNIFDIIEEAPSRADLKQAVALPEEDSVYEVEPVVEEVETPLDQEEEKALPIGAKAVEEMRANLGLMEKKDVPPPEIVSFESLDMAREAEQMFAPPKEMPSPEIVNFESLDMATESEQKFTPPPTAPAAPASARVTPPVQLATDDLRKIAEDAVAKMAVDIFKDLPPPSLPKISDETIRRGIQEAVLKVAREMAREVIEQVAWEVIPQLAETLIQEEIERLKAER